jgi:hypothetical protein
MPTSEEAWNTLVTAYEAAVTEFDAVSDVLLAHVHARTHPTTTEIDAQEIARKILVAARWSLYGHPSV